MQKSLSCLFFGTDVFSTICLNTLHHSKVLPFSKLDLEIVTPPNVRNSPCCPLKEYAQKYNITQYDAPARRSSIKNWEPKWLLDRQKYDVGIAVSFGYFLPKHILDCFKIAINVHPSLLPKYRGPAPIHHTILNGDLETGISIIELDRNAFDCGRILKQTRMSIPQPESINYNELHKLLATQGGKDLESVLSDLEKYKASSTIQDDSRATKAPKINKLDAVVHWKLYDEYQIHRMHRALSDKYPLSTTFKGKRVFLTNISPTLSPPSILLPMNEPPGTCLLDQLQWRMFIKTRLNWLEVLKLRFVNKNEIGIKDFFNGYRITKDIFI